MKKMEEEADGNVFWTKIRDGDLYNMIYVENVKGMIKASMIAYQNQYPFVIK